MTNATASSSTPAYLPPVVADAEALVGTTDGYNETRGFPPFGPTTLAVGAVKRVRETREIVIANAVYLTAVEIGRLETLDDGR